MSIDWPFVLELQLGEWNALTLLTWFHLVIGQAHIVANLLCAMCSPGRIFCSGINISLFGIVVSRYKTPHLLGNVKCSISCISIKPFCFYMHSLSFNTASRFIACLHYKRPLVGLSYFVNIILFINTQKLYRYMKITIYVIFNFNLSKI